MEQITDNMQKYANYKEQMGRLKKALSHQFYLEALFIEYAILEDRLESVLRHSGKWNPKPDQHISIDRKITLVAKLAEEKKGLAKRYFAVELTESLKMWKEDRNRLIHALMKQSLHTEDLRKLSENGAELVKQLSGKTSLYNKALERQAKREKE